MNRRTFLSAASTAALAAVIAPGRARSSAFNAMPDLPDLAVVKSTNYYEATIRAVDELGGIQKFVPRGSRVGLLVNSPWDKPGTYTKPQIAIAVLSMCAGAGAKEIVSIEDASRSYWKRASLSKDHQDLIDALKPPGKTATVAVKGGLRLKEVEIVRDFLECDVLINVPIFKDHDGVHLTGTLKNIMGATTSATNRHFHGVSLIPVEGYYSDPLRLSECIAEANLVRQPTLCIADGTEMITTNGPSGPGKMAWPQVVVAGTDRVAMDSFGATLLNLRPEEIPTIRKAAELGLGSMDLAKMRIARIEL